MLDGALEEADTGKIHRPEAWRFAAFVAAGLFALVVLHALLNRGLPSPQIFADEGGYLGNARYIVSGYGRPTSGYYAGYSLLLAPAAFVTHAATTFYHAVLYTNAGLSIFSPLLALVLVRQTFREAPRWVALITAALVAFAPLVFTFVGLSMSENALVPVVLAVAVLFAHAARDGDLRFMALASAMAVFSYWVSPRGLIVVIAALIALVILAWEFRRFWPVLATGALVFGIGLGAGQLFENAVKGNRRIAGVTNRKSPLIPSLVDPSIWHKWLANALGRLSYIGVSSAGLTIIGLAVAIGWFLGRDKGVDDPDRRVRRCVGAFAFAAPVLTLVISAGGIATRVNAAQIDLWYYGRYVDAVAMPALAIGAAWVLSNPARLRVLRSVLISGAVIAVSAILVPVLDNSRPDESHFNRLNIIALIPIQQAFDHPTLTYQLLIGAGVATALGVLMSTKAGVFGLVTVAVFAGSSLFIHARYIQPNSVNSARQNALAEAVHVLEAHGVSAECIVVDHRSRTYTYWNEYDDRFLLASSRFVAIRGNDDENVDCGPLVITSNPDYGDTRPDVRLVSIENDAPMQLWIDLSKVTSRARDDLTKAGVFFASSPCERMPKDAYKAAFSASVSGVTDPLDLDALVVDADIGHIGTGSPWLGSRALLRSNGCGTVQVAFTVTDEHGATVYRNAVGLPRTLFPGQGVHLHTKVAATSGSLPTLHKGTKYKLYVRLEQVGVRYIGDPNPVVLGLTP